MSGGRIERRRVSLMHDNHHHLSLYAAMASFVDISGLSAAEALKTLESLPRDRLNLVRGWRSAELRLRRQELASLPPALIVNFSLHGFAVSDAGRDGLTNASPALAQRIGDDAWCEAHVCDVFAEYCALGGIEADSLARARAKFVLTGVGSADDMAVADLESIDAYMKIDTETACRLFVDEKLYKKMPIQTRKKVAGLKFFVDGSLGSRSAAIVGAPKGLWQTALNYDRRSLAESVARAWDYGTGVAIHAIGEAAVEIAIGAIEDSGSGGRRGGGARIEHAQFIDERQARRAKELGVTLSMQPNFSSDSVDYLDRLPDGYAERNNPFRMLIDEVGFAPGKDLIFGSDGMPTGLPYAARVSLFPACEGQRLSLDELIAGYGPSRGVSGAIELEIDHAAKDVRAADLALD